MDLNSLAVDPKKEVDGVWHDLDGDAKVKIARIGNKQYSRTLKRLFKPHRRAIQKGTLSDEKQDEIVVKALVENILLSWKGLTEDGKKLKYSKETATRVLLDERYKDFRELIIELAEDAESYREKVLEEEAGN